MSRSPRPNRHKKEHSNRPTLQLWRGCKALKPISIKLVEKLCSNRIKHLAQTEWSVNSAMCYPRHARAGTKETTQVDQPCSQWRGCKALKLILIKLVEKLCSNRVRHLAQTLRSANSAMCYPRHARAGTKENTQIDQPCSQWRGYKALKPI